MTSTAMLVTLVLAISTAEKQGRRPSAADFPQVAKTSFGLGPAYAHSLLMNYRKSEPTRAHIVAVALAVEGVGDGGDTAAPKTYRAQWSYNRHLSSEVAHSGTKNALALCTVCTRSGAGDQNDVPMVYMPSWVRDTSITLARVFALCRERSCIPAFGASWWRGFSLLRDAWTVVCVSEVGAPQQWHATPHAAAARQTGLSHG